MAPTTVSAKMLSAAIFMAGSCPAADALHSAAPPVPHPTPNPLLRPDTQKWWMIAEAKSLHVATTTRDENTTTLESLHEAWEDKAGKGFPTFSVRRVDFQKPAPAFEYMFPDGDSDHKSVLQPAGIYEPFLSYHLGSSLKKCCKQGSGHFVDIGAQYGWYSLLSASHGCAVDAFETVPWFQSLLAYNKYANKKNGLSDKIKLHPGSFLGSSSGERRTVVIPTQGKAPGPEGAKEEQCDHGALCVDVTETTVSQEMAYMVESNSSAEPAACGMRVSAQGLEPEVVEGAMSFIRDKLPGVVIVEVHPGMQKTVKRSNKPAEDMLKSILNLGYVPYLLTWETVRANNLNIAKGSMSNKKFSQPVNELVKKCGVNCIVYLERTW